MPYEIKLDERPAGYAMEAASGVEGTPRRVVVREFTSSEDGELFITRLEGWPQIIISRIPPQARIGPSMVDHMLAIIRPDLTGTVYVNELPHVAQIRTTRAIAAGEEIVEADIADISELRFEGVEVPNDAAVLIVLSSGWRKGLFFDFGPLNDEGDRTYDLWKLLGSYFAYISNQSLFALKEEDWQFLIDQLWFPFISLPRDVLKTLVGRARTRDSLDILLPRVRSFLEEKLPDLLERWAKKPLFAPHMDLLRHAAEEFREGDVVSSTAIIYPRIEGVLRGLHATLPVQERASAANLTARLLERSRDDTHPYSWLLPDMFAKYLEDAYFANFEPGKPAKLSRHSIGHGVAAATDFNQKAASIGFLVVDQLFWFLPSAENADAA